jgi:hypothetical protein
MANRVNAYSIDPILWNYFHNDDNILKAAPIVSYKYSTFISANIEKKQLQYHRKER